MNEDRAFGAARNLGGKVQEGLGNVTGNAKTQADVYRAAIAAEEEVGDGLHGKLRQGTCRIIAPPRPSGQPLRQARARTGIG